MYIQDCILKIDSYLGSSRKTPVIVNVPNYTKLSELISYFGVGANKITSADDFCKEDEAFKIEDFLEFLSKTEETTFVVGISSWLKLFGSTELKKVFRSIFDLECKAHIVIFAYNCNSYLQFKDPRLVASSRLIFVDGDEDVIPSIQFISRDVSELEAAHHPYGINCLGNLIERLGCTQITIVTSKSKKLFPHSIYKISEIVSAFDILGLLSPILTTLPESIGDDDLWKWLVTIIKKKKSWEQVVADYFGGISNLNFAIYSYNTFEKREKWLYYIALKTYASELKGYLKAVVLDSNSVESFEKNLIRDILKFHYKSPDFQSLYDDRKRIIQQLGNIELETTSYLNVLSAKGEDIIYYLSDCSRQEKERIIKYLGEYGDKYSQAKLEEILKIIYPGLYLYIKTYDYNDSLLNEYFQKYKLCKVRNTISPDFENIVHAQAAKREYNVRLQPRSAFLDGIKKDNTFVYFVDAMGVEYLSYITSKCKEKGLQAATTICRSELPSITSLNKDFESVFISAGCEIADIKELDDIKHHGKENYDYQKSKFPFHLIRELEIFDEIIDKARTKLLSGGIDKCIFISDHGASRLSVLHDTEAIWEMPNKGEHCGRCCKTSDIGERPEFATEENGFWVLANYDRFKGGRKACVEVHGGASLEEVAIPIIEVSLAKEDIECFIVEECHTIFVSFRKKAYIKLFVGKHFNSISIIVAGRSYSTEQIDEYYYGVELPDIKKPQKYECDVIADGNIIACGLSFEVKKEGAVEKDLF